MLLLLLTLLASIGGRPASEGGRRRRRDTFGRPVGEMTPTRFSRAAAKEAVRQEVAESLFATTPLTLPARAAWRLAGRPRFTEAERAFLSS